MGEAVTRSEAAERLTNSRRCLVRARSKLMEGLEAWHREQTPHTGDRLRHYYLVFKDCRRNLADAKRRNLRVANPVTHKIQSHNLRVCTHAGRQTKPGHFQCAMDVMRAEYDAKRGWHVVCANAR